MPSPPLSLILTDLLKFILILLNYGLMELCYIRTYCVLPQDIDVAEKNTGLFTKNPIASFIINIIIIIIIIIIINPLTARVVGAPQVTLQPVFSIFSPFSTALWDLANSRPVRSLMLSSRPFRCLPCLLPPFTVSCKMVLARPYERET